MEDAHFKETLTVLKEFGTDPVNGLTSKQVAANRAKFGRNGVESHTNPNPTQEKKNTTCSSCSALYTIQPKQDLQSNASEWTDEQSEDNSARGMTELQRINVLSPGVTHSESISHTSYTYYHQYTANLASAQNTHINSGRLRNVVTNIFDSPKVVVTHTTHVHTHTQQGTFP